MKKTHSRRQPTLRAKRKQEQMDKRKTKTEKRRQKRGMGTDKELKTH